MDHIVYVDVKANELDKVLDGSKQMIIRGATGRKMPYNRVFEGDVLYLVKNDGSAQIEAKCTVKSVLNSEKMEKDESIKLVDDNKIMLSLSQAQYKKWAGKRYLVLIEILDVEKIEPQAFDKSDYSNMDDWLPVEDISKVLI